MNYFIDKILYNKTSKDELMKNYIGDRNDEAIIAIYYNNNFIEWLR